jgi:DNA ligase 1
MKRFTQLFTELDRTTRTNEKVAALERYFSQAPPADAAWALQFLSGRTLPRLISSKNLWAWIADESKLPMWLIDECSDAVGDTAEVMALLLPDAGIGTDLVLSKLVEERLVPLQHLPDGARRNLLIQTWRELNANQRLVWNKLITGNFRIGAARTLVVRALANVAQISPAAMAHRIMGKWQPTAEDYLRLLGPEVEAATVAKPYPFFLASPLEIKIRRGESLEELGDIGDWQFEWKWDGIRAQLIRREDETLIWSRGEEMVTDSFPEVVEAGGALLDGTVLDGEILAWRGESPLPFAALQRRLGRKNVDAKTREKFPVSFAAYDLLEWSGKDIRAQPLSERRRQLEEVVAQVSSLRKKQGDVRPVTPLLPGLENELAPEATIEALRLSPLVRARSWAELVQLQNEARGRGVEGLMLKRISSPYGVGRQRGDWWKWKIDPYSIDAVLIYAQPGNGRRASLFTDYTFGIWENGQLVPFAKAYSGLNDEEIREVDSFVRHNTIEQFGPVHRVKPELVFELAFEGIQLSTRHRSGIAVRFPRMARWRHDKKPEDADSIDTIRGLLG